MKTMRFLIIVTFSGCALFSCNTTQNADQNSSTVGEQNLTIGGKEYSLEELEDMVNFFEEAQNPNDLQRYTGIPIERSTGGLINQGVAQAYIDAFKRHSQGFGQPHAFSYGLDFLNNVIKQLDSISSPRVDSLKYTGIRIYVTKDLTSREWNTVLVGTTENGRDVFSPVDSISYIGDPVYNTSLPCPNNCQ